MVDDNLKLFDDDHEELGFALDTLDNMTDVIMIRKNWPRLLSEFVDLFCAELVRQGMQNEKAIITSTKLVGVLGNYFGGRVCYIPNGERLKQAIRDNRIFLDYQISDGNIAVLAKKYNLTDSHVYSIIREQLALHRKKYQPDMFGGKE
ncbi:Mor transcription activator family protein [Gilliamella sp. Fer4-1]|uniref:Mor transcription activator family protein n=1 Tax=Gilliamella sp. Fer4-1 TaxID=3120242 RepID=UPI00080EA905|nr:Mor transcription activator family protein [Gilliamella apicola]OCG62223.1 transcriptional regulator [Gilliamella apicola]